MYHSGSTVEALTPLAELDLGVKTGFCPDLIVEVTSICDRACSGCYANNIISSKSKLETLQKFPKLFVDPAALNISMANLEIYPMTVSFRGGEPTRHPLLNQIIKETFELTGAQLYLETHGRWLIESPDPDLVDTLNETKSTVKISFDKMHEIGVESLRAMTKCLDSNGVQFVVAITEEDSPTFMDTRVKCNWVPDSKIIFQKKTKKISELPSPPIGVINCAGILTKSLNTKAGYRGER